jgi:DNA-binding beta-propeller fold protein YncE
MLAMHGNCVYVTNHSGGEGVTVVCNDGADVYRLREDLGFFGATYDPTRDRVYLSRRDNFPGLYVIPASPPYATTDPVSVKRMPDAHPYALVYDETTDLIFVVVAEENRLDVIEPIHFTTVDTLHLPMQNEGVGRHGGQGIGISGNRIWVTNYADNSVTVLDYP